MLSQEHVDISNFSCQCYYFSLLFSYFMLLLLYICCYTWPREAVNVGQRHKKLLHNVLYLIITWKVNIKLQFSQVSLCKFNNNFIPCIINGRPTSKKRMYNKYNVMRKVRPVLQNIENLTMALTTNMESVTAKNDYLWYHITYWPDIYDRRYKTPECATALIWTILNPAQDHSPYHDRSW